MATVTNPEVDSRVYAFVYLIRGSEHLPSDFPVAVDFDRAVSGVFLPQDQSGWFSKSRYPARILVLLPEVLVVATHPSSDESEIRIFRFDNPHVDGMLTMQVVKPNIVWVTDLWSPVRDNAKNPNSEAFAAELKKLGITGATLAGGHGANGKQSDLEALMAAK